MKPDKKTRQRQIQKEYWSKVDAVFRAQKGIPKVCACGKPMMEKIDKEDNYDYLPGKRHFICTGYESTEMHFRQPWVLGMQQEVEGMKKTVADSDECIRECLVAGVIHVTEADTPL